MRTIGFAIALCLVTAGCGSNTPANPAAVAQDGGPTEAEVKALIERQNDEAPVLGRTPGPHPTTRTDWTSVAIAPGRAPTPLDRRNGVTASVVYPVRVSYRMTRQFESGDVETRDWNLDLGFYRDDFNAWKQINYGQF